MGPLFSGPPGGCGPIKGATRSEAAAARDRFQWGQLPRRKAWGGWQPPGVPWGGDDRERGGGQAGKGGETGSHDRSTRLVIKEPASVSARKTQEGVCSAPFIEVCVWGGDRGPRKMEDSRKRVEAVSGVWDPGEVKRCLHTTSPNWVKDFGSPVFRVPRKSEARSDDSLLAGAFTQHAY